MLSINELLYGGLDHLFGSVLQWPVFLFAGYVAYESVSFVYKGWNKRAEGVIKYYSLSLVLVAVSLFSLNFALFTENKIAAVVAEKKVKQEQSVKVDMFDGYEMQ